MIKEFSIYLGLVSSTVTLISYKKQEDINKLREKLNESKNIISNIKEKVIELENFQIKHENLSLKLEGKSADFKDIIDNIKYHYDALKSKSISELLKNHHINELENSFGKAENNLENIFSILNKHNNEYINKFIGNNSLFDTFNLFLDNWKDFISNFTTQELGNLGHLLASIIILILLFNIIIIVYSDFLLKYLNWEEKYPKLGVFLKMRRKFQKYTLFVNFIFIIYLLLLIIYVNFSILFC